MKNVEGSVEMFLSVNNGAIL